MTVPHQCTGHTVESCKVAFHKVLERYTITHSSVGKYEYKKYEYNKNENTNTNRNTNSSRLMEID